MGSCVLSVVIPVFNEEGSLGALHAKLSDIVGALSVSYELIFVDDGSKDATAPILHRLAEEDPRVRALRLSRNFGKEAALTAGLEASTGRCVLILDADFQHPPDLIPAMVAAWVEGYDVVNAVKRKRSSESMLYRLFAATFNRLMTEAIGSDMAGASDFKLLDRQVVDAIIACPERNRFFRGLVAWVGFRIRDIEFDVSERITGISKWSPWQLMRYSLTNILAFSSLPLRAVAYIGFLTVLLGFVLLMQTIARYFLGSSVVGFTTVIAVQILIGGMILLSIGVVAIYLSYIYDEQKKRPIYLVMRGRATHDKRSSVADVRTSLASTGGRKP